jgi:RNA polymerase sigma-70 factor, ECF subfamily
VASGNTPLGSGTGSCTWGNCAEADSDNKAAKMKLRMRTEENHLARRIIQYESMTSTPSEIGERLVELLPRLRRFARSLSRNQHDADDLVQSGIERAWTHLAQFKPGANLASWMFGIMKNAWIDSLRARQRRGEVALPEDSGEHPAVSPVDTSTEMWSVSEAMSKLPEDQRLAVALVLVEGLSYKEAAEALEIPMGTLTSRLARGRTALAAALSGNGGPP